MQPIRADSTRTDAAAATAAGERLINAEKVVGIVGADCSGVTTAVVQNVAVPRGMIRISPSATSPALSSVKDNSLFFRTAPSDARQGEVIAEMLKEKGIRAVDDMSLTIETGRINGLIGPNGAGKTTLFNVIAGHYQPTGGSLLLDGEDITGPAPHELFSKGLLRTFQIAHEFGSLTVRENLMMVPSSQMGESLIGVWLQRKRVREQEEAVRTKADEVIDFLELGHVATEVTSNEQVVEAYLGRGLKNKPGARA